ncbi:glycoside hydrolase family 43 protein [Sabulibacter ruber]|uniref:glycoside hydrolase family 43 protein n=1 Tax=Sabulibacter ruber TaxID=2811901 RepID=UPI001A9692F9|nr:glycoside hydrolase family 43 protein [Sabulibacter ruber]
MHQENELITPQGAPFRFEVRLREENEDGETTFIFEVTGQTPVSGEGKFRKYELAERAHTAYLTLFGTLATDFGLRTPQNKRQTAVKPSGNFPYQELLIYNLTPQILYGYGDPAVLRVEASTTAQDPTYYLVATTNDAPDSFPILRSKNLKEWQLVDFVFPKGRKPEWAAEGELVSDYWAPEMHQVGNEFRVYFVARDKNTHELCIGLARSSSPEGPFVPEKAPILKGNVIDPHVFVQDAETTYLFWKEDSNEVWPRLLIDLLYQNPTFIPQLFEEEEDQRTASFILAIWPWAKKLEPMERFLVTQVLIEAVISRYLEFYQQLEDLAGEQPPALQESIRTVQQFMKTPLYAQQMTPNGTDLLGERTKVLENDLAWEAHLVEGMWVTKQNNRFYLFYAGNDFSTDQYGIGVAHADALLGPYQKVSAPILQSTREWWAPGHPSVVTGPDGKPLMILHAYFPGKAGYKEFRAVLAAPLTFEGDQVKVG